MCRFQAFAVAVPPIPPCSAGLQPGACGLSVGGCAVFACAYRQLEDVKRPIENALPALKDKREDTVIKQKEIERFAGLFLQEKQKGEALMQSL